MKSSASGRADLSTFPCFSMGPSVSSVLVFVWLVFFVVNFLVLIARARADVIFTQEFTVGTPIPDLGELADVRTVAFGAAEIVSATVGLRIDNLSATVPAWSGDYYAALGHDTGYAILLNRIGRTATDPYGSGHGGLDVTFADSAAAGDIHLAPYDASFFSSPALLGTWVPDGRAADPALVTDASPRSATLSSFGGLMTDGAWELFIDDDLSGGAGAIGQLVAWRLSLTVAPEPGAALHLADASTALVFTAPQILANDLRNDGRVFAHNGPVIFTGHITGAGSFTGDFHFAGSYAPGTGPAAVTFTGDTIFGSGHVLTLEIGGAASETSYDRLAVSGSLTLGGTLNIIFVNGFVPQPSDFFQFFSAASIGGSFTQINLPFGFVANGDLLHGGGIAFTAIPEPAASVALIGLGGLALAYRRKRRPV